MGFILLLHDPHDGDGVSYLQYRGKRALQWIGSTRNDIRTKNPGSRGELALAAIDSFEAEAEEKVCAFTSAPKSSPLIDRSTATKPKHSTYSKDLWPYPYRHAPAANQKRPRGDKLHKSSKDPNEKLVVITVSVHTANGTRLATAHTREDGTTTQKTTRAGGGS